MISEIEFAGRYTKAKKICITGSNGKTTTTLWTYHILRKAGLKAGLAGNVGNSFARQVAEQDFDYYVIELSSFQLDGMFDFKADIAVILNITPDHLDRYGYQFQNYIDSKFRITQNQTENDILIYCADDETVVKELEKRQLKTRNIPFSLEKQFNEGGFLNEKKSELIIQYKNSDFNMLINDLSLQGKHNTYNAMASAIASKVLQIKNGKIRESLGDFESVEHRLERVTKVNNVEFINDSKATNVNSSWYALESMHKPVIWIAGGVDKGNDYSMLTELVKKKVKALVCLGKENQKLHDAFDEHTRTIDTLTMQDAVKAAYYLSQEGDIVLLSPACASFDLFKNYEDRGQQFKHAVKEL